MVGSLLLGFRSFAKAVAIFFILLALFSGFEGMKLAEALYVRFLLKLSKCGRVPIARFCLLELLTIGHRGEEYVGRILLEPSNQKWAVREIAKYLRRKSTDRKYWLHSLFDQGVPFKILLQMVPSEDWESLAYLHLLSMGYPWDLGVLRRALSHDEAIVRRLAAKHLSLIEAPQMKEEAIELLHRIAQFDPDREVRRYALTAVIRWAMEAKSEDTDAYKNQFTCDSQGDFTAIRRQRDEGDADVQRRR